MTKAMATMVSSGGDIDKLIPMIQGIGNATAFAGKGAAEFQRVIYNLNQSYSSGFLNTMDWKSIELAGVDSKALKEQLLGAAEALGKIKPGVHTIADFRDLLSDKVFTRDVMEKAFTNFAEMTQEAYKLVEAGKFNTASEAIESLSGQYSEIAERSFKAAQEAKSFTEAIDATKDAVSSGWMQTFKLIFGNYEEAKDLWTALTNEMWEWFASGAQERNAILKQWHDGFTRFSLSEDLGEITKSTELLEEYSKKIEELNTGDYLSNQIDYEKTSLKVFNALLTRDINQIGDAISSTAEQYGNLDYLPDIFNQEELSTLNSIVDERNKILETLDDETEKLKVVEQYNKKIGEYVKTTATYKNPFEDADIQEVTSTKFLDTMNSYKEALKADDSKTMLKLWKENGDAMASAFVQVKDIRDLWDQIDQINKNDNLSLREKNSLTEELYRDIVDLTKQYSNIGLVDEITRQQEILKNFFDAVSNRDAESILKIWKEESDLLLDNLDEMPEKVYKLSDEIKNLENTDIITNRIEYWSDYIGIINKDVSSLGKIWSEQNKSIMGYSVENEKILSLDEERIQKLKNANTELEKQNINAEYYKKIGEEILKTDIYKTLWETGDITNELIANSSKYLSTMQEAQKAISNSDLEKIASLWKTNKDGMMDIFRGTPQFKEIKSIYEEIDEINKGIYKTEEEKKWLLDNQYEKLAQYTAEMSNLDEIAEKQKELEEEIVDYFTNAKKGYDTFVEGIKIGLSNITTMLSTIKDAWKEVFGSIKATSLIDVTEKFKEFMESISLTEEKAEALKERFIIVFNSIRSVLLTILAIGTKIFKSFIQPLQEKLQPILKDIFEIIENLRSSIVKTSDNIRNNLSPLEKILSGILDILDPIINGIALFVNWIKELTSQNGEITVFSGLFETIGNIFEFIGKAVKGSVNLFSSIGKGLTDIFGNLKGVLGNFLESKGTDVSKLAEGGFLAYLAIGLTKVINKLKKLDIQQVLEGITKFFTGDGESKGLIGSIQETFETLTNSIKTFTESIKVKMLEVISDSLIKLAAALLIISLVDSDKIASSLGAMAGMLAEMVTTLAIMNQINTGKGFNKTALAFDQIAAGILIMSIALKVISSAQPEQMTKALGFLGLALFEVYLFMVGLNYLKPEIITNSAKAFKKISTGLIMLSIALKIISSINPERMVSTLVLLGVSLAELFAFFVLTSNAIKDASGNKMIALGKALTNMGVGLIALSVALKIMSSIDSEGMSQALMGLLLSLAALGLFVAAMSNFVGGAGFIAIAGGMLILSTALIALGAALGVMGSLKLATIGKGLLTLAGALVVIGLGAAIIGPISPLLLLLSVAIGAFGLALSAAAKGILEFMAAYTIMSAMGPDFVSTLIDVFDQAVSAIVAIIPTFIAGIIDGILMTLTMIKDRIFAIIQLLFEIAVDGIMTLIGPIIDIIKRVIIEIINALDEILPHLIDLCYHFVIYMIQAANENLPDLIDGLFEFLTTTINSLAETIRNKGGEFGTAVGNLASAIVTGIADALVSAIGSWGSGLIEGGKSLWDKVVGFFSGEEAQEGNVNAGYETLSGVEEGVLEKEPELLTTVDTVGTKMTDAMDRKEDSKKAADYTTNGFINQIKDRLTDFWNIGVDAGSAFMGGFSSTGALDYNSPSKATARAAEYVIQGFIGTIKDSTNDITSSGIDLGSTFVDALSNSIRIAEDLLNDDMNPVITPVLDLSNIENNTGAISDLLGANASLNGAMSISGSALANLQNGVLSGGNTITMYNTFELNGVQDMDRDHARSLAEMLYDEMNTLLGNQI